MCKLALIIYNGEVEERWVFEYLTTGFFKAILLSKVYSKNINYYKVRACSKGMDQKVKVKKHE